MISPGDMKGLSANAKGWLLDVQSEFELAPYQERIAITAAQCLDRVEKCRRQIARDGLTTKGRRAGVRQCHPLLIVEGQTLGAFVALIKELGIKPDRRHTIPLPGVRSHHKSIGSNGG